LTKRLPASTVAPELAAKYYAKAVRFRRDAEAMLALGTEFSGNGVAVLCVHAAIAYADAVTIRAAGQKSKSGEHRDAATFLASVVAIRTPDDKAALKALQAVLNRKDEVSYADDLVGEFDAREMMARLDTFAAWADRRYAAMA